MNLKSIPSQRQIRFGEVIRSIISESLIRGDFFNTEIDVTLQRNNVTKQIILPTDVLRVDPNIHQHPSIDAIQRGLKMYDRLNNTFLFENDFIAAGQLQYALGHLMYNETGFNVLSSVANVFGSLIP